MPGTFKNSEEVGMTAQASKVVNPVTYGQRGNEGYRGFVGHSKNLEEGCFLSLLPQ